MKPGKAESLKALREIVFEATTTDDMFTKTVIPFLTFMRFNEARPLTRGILKPSFCMIVQGAKRVHLGSEVIEYGAGDYLAASLDMPASGEVIGATRAKPYLAIRIELDPKELAAIVLEAKIDAPIAKKSVRGAFVAESEPELLEVIHKLLRLLEKPADAKFLADSVKREILYRILAGPNGPLLFQNVMSEQQDNGIGKAVHWIKENFKRPLSIESLAEESNMSISSLHHKFKAVMTMGPLQYQKQLRLQEARRLLLSGSLDAASAAYQVGYESHSQFTREYRRLFGAPPMKDIKLLRSRSNLTSRPELLPE